MPTATFHRIVAQGSGVRVEDIELPFADDAYDTVAEALADADDALHHAMWRAVLQHVEDELHG